MRINLNADMAEGFGPYDIGDDESLLTIVKSANIACGMHGGDPSVMVRTVRAAAAAGVSIGAHPGFNDLWGFGRRQITMKPTDLEHMVAYQIGALQAIAHYAGLPVTHVKVHGALHNMASVDHDYAAAVANAVQTVDAALIHLVMPGTALETASLERGLIIGREAFVDRTYEDDGTLTPRSIKGSVLKDPDMAAARAVDMVRTQQIVSRHGTALDMPFDSLCVHGDEPTAVAVARACKLAFDAANIDIVTLPEML